MLPSKHRLKLKDRGTRSWKTKQEFFTPLFKITYRFSSATASPKIGFVIYGKSGKAARRNRVRRLLKEAVVGKIDKFPLGMEAVFSVNKLYDEQDYENSANFIDKFLSRAGKPLS